MTDLSAATGKMIAGLAVLLAVCVAGAVGYVSVGWSVQDAVFMVVITIFGVGYGEVRPLDSWVLRSITGFVIVAGYGAVIYTVGGFVQLVVDGHVNKAIGARRMKRDIDALNGHTIICGFGRMGRSLAAELHDAGHPFVIIDSNPDGVDFAAVHRMLLIHGDASDEEILLQAGIDRAGVVASVLSDDAANVFVTLTSRAMNPDLLLIARGENRRTEQKLLHCGADKVVLPTEIGAVRMSQLIIRPAAEEMMAAIATTGDLDLITLGLEFGELELEASSPLANRVIGDLDLGGAYGYLIIGIRRVDGSLLMHPAPDVRLAIGDRLVVLGYEDDLPQLGTKVNAPRPYTYRGARAEV